MRPVGQTVRYPALVGSVTVTLSETAPTPSVGIPWTSVTRKFLVSPGANTTPPRPSRVSINLVGVSASNPTANQPATSTTRCVDPELLNKLIRPPPPTPTTTAFGTVCPGTKFKLDARGRSVPAGHTVTKPDAVGSVTVTFNATAPSTVSGRFPRPCTTRSRCSPGPSAIPPSPSRVSINRDGVTRLNPA